MTTIFIAPTAKAPVPLGTSIAGTPTYTTSSQLHCLRKNANE